MPSARDLLQQADTLMRSNRSVGVAENAGDETVPLLTDVAVPGAANVPRRAREEDIPTLTNAVGPLSERYFVEPPPAYRPLSRFMAGTKMPEETIFPLSQMPDTAFQKAIPAEPSERDTEPVFSVTAMRSQLAESDQWDAELLPPHEEDIAPAMATAQTGVDETPGKPVPGPEELAETVYHQVLQNLDLYTERALQEHLSAHLTPIVERATSELLATLHADLGMLIRQFVADAIEKQLGVRPDSAR
ncbi:MAG: hypothetical protein ABI854_04975 [Betaproteobacteria bacterium]